MLDLRAQSIFTEAAADLMRIYASAGRLVVQQTADQGFIFWMQALQLSARGADARWNAWLAAEPFPWRMWSMTPGARIPSAHAQASASAPPTTREPADTAFASYRTAGGHAAAQVIVSGE